jgi:2-oxoacid:acceptor oxidoreductase delta subunit (pyruvate/2-ketoisovalerate family)
VGELTWQELPPGGVVRPGGAPQPRTGGWRTGARPEVDFSKCIDCLLCWLYCPDDAIRLHGTTLAGVELAYCKGCELCATVCPVGAIEMVAE